MAHTDICTDRYVIVLTVLFEYLNVSHAFFPVSKQLLLITEGIREQSPSSLSSNKATIQQGSTYRDLRPNVYMKPNKSSAPLLDPRQCVL